MEKERRKWSPLEIVLFILEILFCVAGFVLAIYSCSVDGLNLTVYAGMSIVVSSGVNKFRRRKNLSNWDRFSIILLAAAAVLFVISILT